MRKLFITLSALALLALGGAFAQDVDVDVDDDIDVVGQDVAVGVDGTDQTVDLPGDTWAGLSVGYPGFNIHFGREDVFGGADLRGTASVNYGGAFGLGADILADLPIDLDTPYMGVYAGGGAVVGLGGGFGFGVQGLIGGEYRLAEAGLPEGGVFLELGPAISVAPDFDAGFVGRLGFNYHF